MAIASIRPPAVAGAFYPDDPRVLRAQITEMLAAVMPLDPVEAPKAVIVPHAGYMYSGPVAACAYAAVAGLRDIVQRVVLLGPVHRVPVREFAIPAAQVYATPLGEVPVSRNDWVALQSRKDVVVDDRPHAPEHSLEVQLPFLQTVLGRFELVPVLVGNASTEQVADLLNALWGGPETLIVISSDLSHYSPYDHARTFDRGTVDQILRLQTGLNHEQACGATPVNGLLSAATGHGLEAHLLDLRNSGDTAGDRSRVVGYCSVAFCESDGQRNATRH